jgi:hypothetical protein
VILGVFSGARLADMRSILIEHVNVSEKALSAHT